MGYVDVLIPLAGGMMILGMPDAFVKPSQPDYLKKRRQLRLAGYGLLIVSAVYFSVKVFFR